MQLATFTTLVATKKKRKNPKGRKVWKTNDFYILHRGHDEDVFTFHMQSQQQNSLCLLKDERQ